MIAPIFAGAILATFAGLILGELAPFANRKRQELLRADQFARGNERFNFAYSAEHGRVYKIGALRVNERTVHGIDIERKGAGPEYPSYILSATSGMYDPARGWLLKDGVMHVIPDTTQNIVFRFDSARARHFDQRPIELTASPKAPEEMRFMELGRFIGAMERSGADVNELRVERMLKIAVPVTCIVILLFGAPLATSTQRGGAAYGIGISLATTMIFLVLIQLTKAIGSKGVLPPDLAAWIPSIMFGVVGTYLFLRVRT